MLLYSIYWNKTVPINAVYHVDRVATYTLQINTFFCTHNTLRKIWEYPEDKPKRNSQGQRAIFDLISQVESLYAQYIILKPHYDDESLISLIGN